MLICDMNIHVTICVNLKWVLTFGFSFPSPTKLVADFFKVQSQPGLHQLDLSFLFQSFLPFKNNLSTYYYTFFTQLLIYSQYELIL